MALNGVIPMIAKSRLAFSRALAGAVGFDAIVPAGVRSSHSAEYPPVVMPYWTLLVISFLVGPLSGELVRGSQAAVAVLFRPQRPHAVGG